MPDKPNKDEGFVSRWSRRKQRVAEAESVDTNLEQSLSKNSDLQADSSDPQTRKDEIIDPEVVKAEKLAALNKLTDEDMPDIETLDENSDFSGFMSTSVSEGLRNIALKKLFMGKSYNIRDGLDEYDGDYTKFEKMPTGMVTSDMKHMVRVEAKKKLEKEQEEARQKMIASGELDDDFDGIEEFEDDEAVLAEVEEEYIDEHINVEGFDTTVASEDEITDDDINKINKNEDEEVA